jgi:hypothetical protein
MAGLRKAMDYFQEHKLVVTAILLVVVFGGIFLAVSTSKVKLQGKSLKISGMYGMEISMDSIESASMEYSLPKGLRRDNGIDLFGGIYIGNFSSSDMGKMKLFVYSKEKPYMYITLKEGNYKYVIISLKDKEEMQALYDSVAGSLK